jgi:hypothetical protein
MTADPPAEPSPRALGESLAALAAQLADLRSEIRAINERLDQAGLRADVNLAARFEDLAQTVADALESAAPHGPAAPYWIGLDHDTYPRAWPSCGDGPIRCCASTTAATSCGTAGPATSTPSGSCPPWRPSGTTPTAAHAPTWPGPWSSYDRWLPGTMRRITGITGKCMPHCVMLRGPGDWAVRPGYR